ncbi:tetratricopeptide repeat protein [uncultured Flavobacterium sp.]|uniref:tetratricopeptide repeat protein n=1 Tax=uncultured Flavobacterium sp. TaxID=165435 RepID=UPI0025CF43ED|nr:tetratricopeptide repeat protein [uncultured Flavobacterium sp.]
MKIKISFYSLMLSGFMLWPVVLQAQQQQEPDKIELEENEFENHFFEALKQKGIENYDKALESLRRCLKLRPNSAVTYNEIGKNQLALKHFVEAEYSFKQATALEPDNRWYWQGLYDVYYTTQNWNMAIPIVQKLTKWRKEFYEEDLVSLYMYTMQYGKALALIDQLDEKVGKSTKREAYRLRIMSNERFRKPQKEALEEAIKKNPKDELNYMNLIHLYLQSNQEKKAEEVTKRLQKEIPDSDWAQVSLFKENLDKGNGEGASEALFKVLASTKIEGKIKHHAFNDFLIYVNKNPQFNDELVKAVTYFEGDKNVNVPKEVGKFFFIKDDHQRAKVFFEKTLTINADDIETVELLLYSYDKLNEDKMLLKTAVNYLDLYPTQAKLYYFAGLASNKLGKFKKAKNWLQDGIDFVVENIELEANFNKELGKAYEGLGDTDKKDTYFKKAEKLLQSRK